MRIGIIVKEIAHRKAAKDEGDAIDVTLARELIGSVGDILLLAAKPPSLLNEVALRTRLSERRAGLLRLAVRKAGSPGRAVQAIPLVILGVEIELGAIPQPHTKEGGRRPGALELSAGWEAVSARISISCAESRIALRQERRLRMDVPDVRLRQRGLLGRLQRDVAKVVV